MQLCSYRRGGDVRAGAVRTDGAMLDLTDAARQLGGGVPDSVSGWVGYGPDALPDLARVAEAAAPVGRAAELDIVAPLGRPARNVLCVGASDQSDREMQTDLARLSRACCQPKSLITLQGAPLPAAVS